MAQKKNTKQQNKNAKPQNKNKMTRNQKIMGVIGVFIILSMVVGSIATLFVK